MLNLLARCKSIHIACGVTDLRKNVDGLAIIVKQEFNIDPFSDRLFLFCNRSRNRLKALVWDKNGFIMLYKRLDGAGAKFNWPNEPEQMRDITEDQLALLLSGFSIDPPKGFKEVTSRTFY